MKNIETLIRGARIMGGTGNPWTYGDVLISGDKILAIAAPGSAPVCLPQSAPPSTCPAPPSS